MAKSDLIIQETPLVFQPSLALMIGLNEAIVLQTLQYCCNQKKFGKVHDGKRWIYNTLEQWREFSFPFWTTRTIGEIFRTLETMGLIESDQLDLKKGSAMKYYTVTHSALNILTREKLPHVEESSTPMWKNLPEGKEESSRSARARLVSNITKKQTKTRDADFSEEEKEKSDNELSCPPDQTQADATAKGRTASEVGKEPPHSAAPSQEFDEFWKEYPRKVAKDNARRAWAKQGCALEQVLPALRRQRAGWDNPKYIPHPATWLNGRRWEDETDAPNAVASEEEELFWEWMRQYRPWEGKREMRLVPAEWVEAFRNGEKGVAEHNASLSFRTTIEEDGSF